MAGEPLALSPALRPWLKAGLATLLLDGEERALALRAAPVQEAAALRPAFPARRPGASPAPPAPRATARDHASPAAALQTPVQTSGGTPARNVRPAETLSASGRVLPPEAWPAAWQSLKNRRPLPPRPLVFWTYAGLGDDLMGTPDPARQQVIVRMLKELRHPGGTHVFWPYALPGDSAGAEAPSLFWSGAALLRPRALLLFGSEARDALAMPKRLVPYCQDRVDGRLVIQLPQPATLAGKEDAFRRALAFLSRLLAFCSTLRT